TGRSKCPATAARTALLAAPPTGGALTHNSSRPSFQEDLRCDARGCTRTVISTSIQPYPYDGRCSCRGMSDGGVPVPVVSRVGELLSDRRFGGSGFVAADDPSGAAPCRHQVVRCLWAPRPNGIGLGMSVGLPRADERIDDLPGELDLLSARKSRIAAGND